MLKECRLEKSLNMHFRNSAKFNLRKLFNMKRGAQTIPGAGDINSPLTCNWISEFVILTHFQISRRTLWAWHAEGLPKYTIGKLTLYKESEINEWIEKHRKMPQPKKPKES
jgi:predicted DNA-binding transcriptional regulator AlpA